MKNETKPPSSIEETTNSDHSKEQWKNTRDLLQKALSDWDQSEKLADENQVAASDDQKIQKDRLEKLLDQLKEQLNDLSKE